MFPKALFLFPDRRLLRSGGTESSSQAFFQGKSSLFPSAPDVIPVPIKALEFQTKPAASSLT
jgi:hypothetical protein